MSIRDAAITDQIPRMSREEDFAYVSNPRLVYNLGHAVFEFIEARYGKEGIRQFLYTFRKNIVGGGMEDIYAQAFRIRPEEFDEAFDKWLKERFKPFRDKQRPSDYGKDLAPDSEKTSYSQVYAFAPSPSGEIIAALTGNRAEGEADLILLSARDGAVLENLTKGYTEKFENVTWNDDFVAGRTIGFDPRGDTIAFFARKGKRRSLYLVSVLTGKIIKRVSHGAGRGAVARACCPTAGAPCSPASRTASPTSGCSTWRPARPRTSPRTRSTTATRRSRPTASWSSTPGASAATTRSTCMPLDDPAQKTQLTFGTYDDTAPIFSPDGDRIYYSSTEDDDIYNIRSLDLKTGVIRQYTDALGGTMTPAVLPGRGSERVAFISYFKGEYRLQTLETAEPLKEVEQEVGQTAHESSIDFQPDVTHQVVAENKRKKRTFEKLFLEGRPPLNVGVTSSGDFFGGSQVALSDVLGDHNFTLTAVSRAGVPQLRGHLPEPVAAPALGRQRLRLHPVLLRRRPTTCIRTTPGAGAFATQRYSGAVALAQYPLDKFRRLELPAGVLRVSEGFENPEAEAAARLQAQALGRAVLPQQGSIAPISLNFVGETTRFREFGPLSGHTFSIGLQTAPGRRAASSPATPSTSTPASTSASARARCSRCAARGFKSGGAEPGHLLLRRQHGAARASPTAALVGQRGLLRERRVPLSDHRRDEDAARHPGPGARHALRGHRRRASSRASPTTSPPASPASPTWATRSSASRSTGFRLVDGRASYGIGLQFFFLGYPMHFDWTKITDLQGRPRPAGGSTSGSATTSEAADAGPQRTRRR